MAEHRYESDRAMFNQFAVQWQIVRGRSTVQHDDVAALGNQLVGQRPDRTDPGAPGDEQHLPALRAAGREGAEGSLEQHMGARSDVADPTGMVSEITDGDPHQAPFGQLGDGVRMCGAEMATGQESEEEELPGLHGRLIEMAAAQQTLVTIRAVRGV